MPSGRGIRSRDKGLADLLTKNKQLAAALEKEKGSCARLRDELIELRHRDLKNYEEALAMKQTVSELTTKFAQIQTLAQEASSLAEQAVGEPTGGPCTTPSSRRAKPGTDKPSLPTIPSESPARSAQHCPPVPHPTCRQLVSQLLPTVGAVARQAKQPRQQRSHTKPNSFQWPVRRLSDLQWPARRSGPTSVNCCKTPLDLASGGRLQPAVPFDFGSCSPLMAAGMKPSGATTIDTSESAITADSSCEAFPDLPLGTSDHRMEGILRDIEEQLEGATLTAGMDGRLNSQPTTPNGQTDKRSRQTHSQKEDNKSLRLVSRTVTSSKAKRDRTRTGSRALMEITNTHNRPWGPDTAVVPMTTLDLVDLSTSLPSPISEGATLHTPHPSAVVANQQSHTLGQEQTSALRDGTNEPRDNTSALGQDTRVGYAVPLALPLVEAQQRKERRGMPCSLQKTTVSKNQPRATKADSPSRKRVRGRSAIPQEASSREALSDMQQLATTQTRRSSRTSSVKTICYKEQPLNWKKRRGDPGSDPFFLDAWRSRLMKTDQNRLKVKQKHNL